jgi:aprataxin
VTDLNPKRYDELLKESLTCFKCRSPMKNMPTLKEHLKEEWDKQAAKSKSKAKAAALKRKAEVVDVAEAPPESTNSPHNSDEAPSKKTKRE